jgi:hypothetical protein
MSIFFPKCAGPDKQQMQSSLAGIRIRRVAACPFRQLAEELGWTPAHPRSRVVIFSRLTAWRVVGTKMHPAQ